MPNGDVNEGDRISITRSDGFLLMMTASTIESAREWRAAIKATLEILNEIYGDSRGTSGKIRRSNLSTIYDDESLKHVVRVDTTSPLTTPSDDREECTNN
jgi:hypothetical protein